jgi:hypothetical protein
MVARSPHLVNELAGVVSDDGVRQNSELDKYLDKETVSKILAEAAEVFRRQAHERAKAEMSAKLFLLAGRYGSLLNLLNEVTSPTDKDDDDKR